MSGLHRRDDFPGRVVRVDRHRDRFWPAAGRARSASFARHLDIDIDAGFSRRK
jgi:hypothetical protein